MFIPECIASAIRANSISSTNRSVPIGSAFAISSRFEERGASAWQPKGKCPSSRAPKCSTPRSHRSLINLGTMGCAGTSPSSSFSDSAPALYVHRRGSDHYWLCGDCSSSAAPIPAMIRSADLDAATEDSRRAFPRATARTASSSTIACSLLPGSAINRHRRRIASRQVKCASPPHWIGHDWR